MHECYVLGIEATQIVCVPSVTCLDPFFVEQSIYSWFDHACHDERAIPLGLRNDYHVSRIDVLSQDFLISLGFLLLVA